MINKTVALSPESFQQVVVLFSPVVSILLERTVARIVIGKWLSIHLEDVQGIAKKPAALWQGSTATGRCKGQVSTMRFINLGTATSKPS